MSFQPVTRKRWQIDPRIPIEIDEALSGYPAVLRQLLFNRGVQTWGDAETYLSAAQPIHDPLQMLGMEAAVERLFQAIDQGEKIAVYGDYDVDGVTATAVMVQVLRRLGGNVKGYIPNRFDEGYGLNNEALAVLAQEQIRLVLTVDCGIRSPREVEFARTLGVDIIISDHHEPHEELPCAVSVICPKQAGCGYPEKNLAGVGLAYKITQALALARPEAELQPEDWLDLVAVGTVADVVPLKGENRALVRAGLQRLRSGNRQGLWSLAGAAEFDLAQTSARDIGFILGPRLNAAGRLESALQAYDLLMETDVQLTGELALKLDDQNRHRQEWTRQMQEEAELLTAETRMDHLMFAVDPSFNMGVVGLVASRLTETYYRPSIVGAVGEECTRASCRSIPEFHITHALDECTDLLVRHGGHALAAGFTVKNANLVELIDRLRQIAERELGNKDLRPVLRADMEIALDDLRPEVLKYIDALEPTGLGNPQVLFVARNVRVVSAKTVGGENQHLKLTVASDRNVTFDGIGFRLGYWASQLPTRMDILFAFEKNVFRGRESLQLNLRDLKPANQPD